MLYKKCWSQENSNVIYWYDNIWRPAPTMSKSFQYCYLTAIKDQFVLAVSVSHLGLRRQLVEMLDVSSHSPCWIPMMDMLVSRVHCGIGTLDNCVYAVSHTNTLRTYFIL